LIRCSYAEGVKQHSPGLPRQRLPWVNCPVVTVVGVAGYVHLLVRQARTSTLAGWVRELKRTEVTVAERATRWPRGIRMQVGYGAFSVSQSQSTAVRRHITRQEAHHCRVSFQDELRTLLDRHRIAYDERYLWDWQSATGRRAYRPGEPLRGTPGLCRITPSA
jgi:putative transposase